LRILPHGVFFSGLFQVVSTILCNAYSLLSLPVFFSPQSPEFLSYEIKGRKHSLGVFLVPFFGDEKKEDEKNLNDLGSSLAFLLDFSVWFLV